MQYRPMGIQFLSWWLRIQRLPTRSLTGPDVVQRRVSLGGRRPPPPPKWESLPPTPSRQHHGQLASTAKIGLQNETFSFSFPFSARRPSASPRTLRLRAATVIARGHDATKLAAVSPRRELQRKKDFLRALFGAARPVRRPRPATARRTALDAPSRH